VVPNNLQAILSDWKTVTGSMESIVHHEEYTGSAGPSSMFDHNDSHHFLFCKTHRDDETHENFVRRNFGLF
jgi:hypothetical protein